MSPQGNKYEYANEFDGNLHKESESVPVRVKTNLRIMSKEDAREAWLHRVPFGFPEYRFIGSQTGTENPSINATGRHYFTF